MIIPNSVVHLIQASKGLIQPQHMSCSQEAGQLLPTALIRVVPTKAPLAIASCVQAQQSAQGYHRVVNYSALGTSDST